MDEAEPQLDNPEFAETINAIINGSTTTAASSRGVCVVVPGGCCSGALVAPQWVITARHCLNQNHDPNALTVEFNGVSRYVTHVTVHPKHNERVDVAMLHLASPYTTAEAGGTFNTSNISFYSGQTSMLIGLAATCFGFGDPSSVEVLKKGIFTIATDPPGPIQDTHKFFGYVQPNALNQTFFDGDSGAACWIGNQIVGIHKSSSHSVSGEAFGAWATKRRQCPTWDVNSYGTSFCTEACPCDVGEGDCDNNAQCISGLICKTNVGTEFGLEAGADVCAKPSSCPAFNPANPLSEYCDVSTESTCPCSVGEGDCDNDNDCGSGLVCIQGTGPSVGLPSGYAICDYQPYLGCPRFDNQNEDTEHCSELCPCGIGQGDCDNDDQCRGGLVCMSDLGPLVGLGPTFDICMKP